MTRMKLAELTSGVPANVIVPGDVLVLEAGDITAADARLLTAHSLSTNEAALIGESALVDKRTEPTAPDTPLAERRLQSVFPTRCDRCSMAASTLGWSLDLVSHRSVRRNQWRCL